VCVGGCSFFAAQTEIRVLIILNFLSFDPNVIDDVVQTLEMLEKRGILQEQKSKRGNKSCCYLPK
jgi:hypothetical protein